jgi:putative nucleotidyltransferase with HDIG domain
MEPDNQDMMERILAGVDKIPPMPQVVFKAQKILADPDSSTNELASLLETDQAIAAKVLKMANSAFYGMRGKVASVKHASLVLGYRNLGEIITAAGIQKTLEKKLPGYGLESEDLWRHSLSVALGSKIIAERKNPDLEMVGYTAGLIHDIGKIILDPYVLEQKDAFDSILVGEQQTFLDAERQLLGFDHAEIAAEICEKWGIPETISSAIRYHHSPTTALEVELAFILHMADYISLISGDGDEGDKFLYELEDGTMDFLDLDQDDAGDLTLEIAESVANMLDSPNEN